MAEAKGAKAGDGPVVIKKYANRRLYNTASSTYVTLEHLADMVRKGVDFVVYDAKSNDDANPTHAHRSLQQNASASLMSGS